MSKRMLLVIAPLLLAVVCGQAAAADEAAEAARKLEKRYARAVVHVEGVLSVKAEGQLAAMMGGEKEQKISTVGTVVDASGLTVVSLMSLNPIGESRKINIRSGGQPMSAILKGEVSEVRIRLTDGTELSARVVLKDEDLDLAFIAPKAKPDADARKQLQNVDLNQAAPKADRLAQVVLLGRLDKNMNRELAVHIRRIVAVVTKPRTFYFLGGGQPGTPVFTPDGKLLGINVFRKKPGSGGGSGRTLSVGGTGVVLPTKDVKRVADQAAEEMARKPAEKPADDAKDDKPTN